MKWLKFWDRGRAQRDEQHPSGDVIDWLEPQDGMQGDLEPGIEDESARRRRMEAEAFLAERLQRLSQLDEIRTVDDGLISNAEYQLYLDECRAASGHGRPDHWLAPQFPPGEGRRPVLGVRYRDAQSFCRWLTERDREGRCYRLPRADESDLAEMPRTVQRELPAGGGYWVTDAGGQGRLVRASHRECSLRSADLAAWIERDLEAGRDLYVESVLAQGRDLAGSLGLDPDLDRTEARELAIELVDAIERVHDRARDLDRRLAESLVEASDGARRIDYALDGGAARDLGQVVLYAHAVDRALGVAHYRTHALPRASGLTRAISRASAQGRNLYAAVARAGVSDVVRILLLTGNRTSAVDRAHLLVRDVVQGLKPAAGLAADLEFAHTLSRVQELDLAMLLVRACDVSRPFDLDRLVAGGMPVDLDRRGEDLAREMSRVRAVLHDPDLDHAGAHAIDRAQARALERALVGDLERVHALSRCSELARGQALACVDAGGERGNLMPDWPHALVLLVDRRLWDGAVSERSECARYLRMYVRLGALACAIEVGALLQTPPDLWTDRPLETGESLGAWRDRLEAQREAALDVYIQLGILEDRVEGHLPAWEGIRIVGERGLGN